MLTVHCHLADPRLRRDISRYSLIDGGAARHQTITNNTLYIHLPGCELLVDDRAVGGDALFIAPERAISWELRSGAMLLVNFVPGGVTRLFGLDASRMAGFVGWEEPLPHARLAAAADAARSTDRSPAHLVAALDRVFLDQWPEREPEGLAECAYEAIVESESPGAFDLAQLADDLDVSQRTLQRVFKRRYGVTMARYRRYYRLWGAIQVTSDKPSIWKHLPPEYSYVDQSHLVRDAREVAGVLPGDLQWASRFRTRYYPHGSFRAEDAAEMPSQLPEWRAHYAEMPGSRHWLPDSFYGS